MIPEETDPESEVRVSEALLARWRAKQKTAGIRKGSGFQDNRQSPRDQQEPLFPKDVLRGSTLEGHEMRRRDKIGHWRRDAACEKGKNSGIHRSEKSEITMSQNFHRSMDRCHVSESVSFRN